ncbi:alpha/beta hydrolase [Segetibacter koreensis]|uniref:alpha/beta hydrolase n=1 Tax=Segetibacter koreensis TaxID=398037 RepID=UPI000375BF0F|nr:alpha/beta hydrolase family protein [Segetibacter koreensis]
MRKSLVYLTILLFLTIKTFAATVDTIAIRSNVMNKTYKAVIVLPASYASNTTTYPVLYLLHGGYGHFDDWIRKTPEKTLIQRLADQYNMIVVMPEGEVFSYYLNSPVNKESQFETYISKEVVEKIDNTYHTIKDRKGRAITGLSMGGYGALCLSARHPDLFCAAGSMSGALNPDMQAWKMAPDMEKGIRKEFEKILGPLETNRQAYADASVINMADKIKAANIKLIFDDGTEDFLIEANRELHRRLVFNSTPHDYSERPGSHTWDYWQNSLPFHALFFSKVFKENGSYVN